MAWFKPLAASKLKGEKKAGVSFGYGRLGDGSGAATSADKASRALETRPACGAHFPVRGCARLGVFLDEGSEEEAARTQASGNRLELVDSNSSLRRIAGAEALVGSGGAAVRATGRLHDRPVGAGALKFRFLGSSMGTGARMGRVIEQTLRQKLPKDFQRSEFLLRHGVIDQIVTRDQLRAGGIDLLVGAREVA